jgi:hypothetical protein
MQKIRKSELLYPQHPLLKKEVRRPFNANLPQVYKNEPLEVIVEYLRILRNDGHDVTMADVQSEPEDEVPRRRKRKQVVAQEEEPEPPQKKKKILKKIKIEAVEERTKHKHDQVPEKSTPAEVAPVVVQEESEDLDDDLPLSKRPRKRAAPEASTQQGNVTASAVPSDISLTSSSAQGLISNPDLSQPLNLILPGSTLIFPTIPPTPPSSADTAEIIHDVDRISDAFETMSDMRQEKLDELVSLSKDFVQTISSEDNILQTLEQHYNGQFE